MNLKLSRGKDANSGAQAYNVTGTIAEPHVQQLPAGDTKAELKR
ncbi:MAG TPA: hypothetical protein VND65_11900 [Candidatus Binatia bacterium]|nr:hypothetical protein [Candidatus Binatia bacterium]